MSGIRVLVVDDSALMRKAIRTILQARGDFEVVLARNGADALDQIPRVDPHVVTLDVNMPEMDGLTCLAEIMREFPRPVVMVSSLTEQGALVTLEAMELGAVDYVPKLSGTVSLDLDQVGDELADKVRVAARSRPRAGGLASRLRQDRELEHARARERVGSRPAPAGPPPRGTPAPRPPVVRASTARSAPSLPGACRPGQRPVDTVVIGSSTGGPGLLGRILAGLPATTSASVFVAQHMPASFTRTLADRLDSVCPLPVQEVSGVVTVRPGHVYLARGDADMVLTRRGAELVVRPSPASTRYRWHPSVDRLVDSVMEAVDPTRTVGVLVTGMGDDGAEQMARLHEAGGRTIAESEETAVVWGMPGELVGRGGADLVLAADDIPTRLAAWL